MRALVLFVDGRVESSVDGLSQSVRRLADRNESMIPTPTSDPIRADMNDPAWCAAAVCHVLAEQFERVFFDSVKTWTDSPVISREPIPGRIY